jgi:hypothetical protein
MQRTRGGGGGGVIVPPGTLNPHLHPPENGGAKKGGAKKWNLTK